MSNKCFYVRTITACSNDYLIPDVSCRLSEHRHHFFFFCNFMQLLFPLDPLLHVYFIRKLLVISGITLQPYKLILWPIKSGLAVRNSAAISPTVVHKAHRN